MSQRVEWLPDNRIKIKPPSRPKLITGTRLAAIMGLNRWNTPFKTWCEITRTWQEDFKDTIYTAAGKIAEPKQAEYVKKSYYMPGLTTPTEVFGENYFNRTYGNFFQDPIYGGMWDFLEIEDGKAISVLEMKTTKRSEDWKDDIPEYYALQAALYAYLLGVDQVYMVASFLQSADYEDPEKFQPSSENTIIRPFKLSERYPNFKRDYIDVATQWWNDHVLTGISPPYDERADAEPLAALRTAHASGESLEQLFAKAEALKEQYDKGAAEIAGVKKELTSVTADIKYLMEQQLRPGDTDVTYDKGAYEWKAHRYDARTADFEAMERDGVLDKYTTVSQAIRLTTKKKEQ